MSRVLSRVGVIAVALTTLVGCKGPGAQSPADAAEQPIAFFHSVHAGDNEIPCLYCHFTADESPTANIPSVQLCVGCHIPGSGVIDPALAQLGFPAASRDSTWNAEALKLVGYWQRQEAIPWVEVHDLPAHVQFPHVSHVRVGVQCQTCHGPVEEMEEVYKFSSLQMGWCVDCHRGEIPLSDTEQASIEENSRFVQRIARLASTGTDVQGIEATRPGQIASTDCTVCHY